MKEFTGAGFTTVDTSGYSVIQPPPPRFLTFGGCGISINLQTGEVTIPEGMTLDEASRAIWEGLSRHVVGRVGS